LFYPTYDKSQLNNDFAALVLEASPMAALVREFAGQGPLIFVSDAIAQFGYDPKMLVRQRATFPELIHPDDRSAVLQRINNAVESGVDRYDDRYRILTADRNFRWVSDWTSITRDGDGKALQASTLLLDVTAQHEAEVALADIYEGVPGALYQYRIFPDRKERFEYMSPGCADLFGRDLDDLKSNPRIVWDVVVKEDMQALAASAKTSFERLEIWKHEWRIHRPNGEVRWVRAHGKPRQLTDGSVRWHTVVVDITDLKR
jgi:PAS domain S-box-containing protein